MISMEQVLTLPDGMLDNPVDIQLNIGQCLAAAKAMECAATSARMHGLEMPEGARREFESLKSTFETAAVLALSALKS